MLIMSWETNCLDCPLISMLLYNLIWHSLLSIIADRMTTRRLVWVTRKWTFLLFLSYFGWALEKVKIVDCTVTNYGNEEYRSVSDDYWNFQEICIKNSAWNQPWSNANFTQDRRELLSYDLNIVNCFYVYLKKKIVWIRT